MLGRRSGEIYGNNHANQQHGEIDLIKNRALNRVPLKWLSGPQRNGHSSAGEGTLGPRCFHHATISTDRAMLSAQPVLTIAFFFFWIPDTLPAPPPLHNHSSGGTLTGHVWEGGKMDERARGGSDARVAHPDCLQVLRVSSSPDAAFPASCANLAAPPLPACI